MVLSRFFFVFLAIFLWGSNIQDIDKNIVANKSKLQEKDKEKSKLNNLLNTLGETINKKHNQIKILGNQIQNVQQNINKNQSASTTQEQTLKQYQTLLNNLGKKKLQIQNDIINIIIKDMAFIMVLNHQSPISPDDIILQEIFKSLNKDSKARVEALTKEENQYTAQIAQINQNIHKITGFINTQKDKKQKLQSMIKEQKKLIANLENELETYNKKLKEIDDERKSLDKILTNLNILKQNKEKELQAQKEREKAQKQSQSQAKQNITNNLQAPLDVKQVANSYQSISTTKYKGPKTISPLESYKVEQKFGPYFDPVYKLKVFNESVTLVSNVKNAVVRNIFEGKVVYAKEVPILKKVIIIEHKNEMHTIYSQLDKIAPTIKPGLRIQKGYVIGRVEWRLGFEVTQKDKHIDPLEIISKSK